MTAQAAMDKNEEAFKSSFAVTSRVEQALIISVQGQKVAQC